MQAINFALTLPVEESGPRLLLLIIAHHVNYRTGDMFVGQGELAEEVKRDERTVRRYLSYLEESGFITRQQQRLQSGQRGTDRIVLIGYLEWQDIIEKGGVMPDPKTRGKPVQKPADKTSGRDETTGQNDPNQPDKNTSPTGHVVSGTRGTTINQFNHSAPERASDESARAPVAKKHATSFELTPSDVQWDAWMTLLTDRDRRDLVMAAQEARRMEVFGSRWPSDSSPFPRINGRPAIEKRKVGDAA